ncbi:MAG TPA: alcohol dehydrogenase catalytic domain-containing protein [Candidatus Limnocylindrales bacterium]|nr:alcohol dehydrogenase catalytic domain-containing protein [Candidatus Limnocylindrales bacterium]
MRLESHGHMTAAILYGREDLKIETVDIPRLSEDEVLVRVEVALTCGTDLKVWKQGSHPRMIHPPALFGHELAGVVEDKGRAVNGGVHRGMRVVPSNSAPCNVCLYCRKGQPNLCEDLLFNNGAYAEFIRIPGRIVRENMLEIPEAVSFVDAAMAEPLACVLRGIHETGIQPGDTVVVIGCGPIGLKFIRVLSGRDVRVIALAKRKSQIRAAERLGAVAAFNVTEIENPIAWVRELTEGGRGADAVIEAVGSATTWQWAIQMVRKGGTVNLFGGCPRGTQVNFDPAALHYSEITLKSTFHHTPRFIREALETIARGEIRATDFITGEVPLADLPNVFEHMKHRNGELKTAVIP